jgi:hypothetical protein
MTIWPAGNVAGLGEKDCAPLIPMTLIVTVPLGGVGVGVGAGVVGVGEDGLPPELLSLPQPQAASPDYSVRHEGAEDQWMKDPPE